MYKTSLLKLYRHNDELDVRNILGSLIGVPLSRTKVKPYIYTSGRGYYHQNKSNEKTRWFGNSSCREFCDWAVLKYGYGSTIGSARVCRWKGAILESIAKFLVKSINTHRDRIHLTTFSTLKKVSQLHV